MSTEKNKAEDFMKAREERMADLKIFDLVEQFREQLEDLATLTKERPSVLPEGYVIYGQKMPGLYRQNSPPPGSPHKRSPSPSGKHVGVGRATMVAVKILAEEGGWASIKKVRASMPGYPEELFGKTLQNLVRLGRLRQDGDVVKLTTAGREYLRGGGARVQEGSTRGATAAILGCIGEEGWKSYAAIHAECGLPPGTFAGNFRNCYYRGYIDSSESGNREGDRRRFSQSEFRLTPKGVAFLRGTDTGDEGEAVDLNGSEPEADPRDDLVTRKEPEPVAAPAKPSASAAAILGLLPACHSDLEQALRDAGFDVADLGQKLHEMRDEDLIHVEAGRFMEGPPRKKTVMQVQPLVDHQSQSPIAGIELSPVDAIGEPAMRVTLSAVHIDVMRAVGMNGASPNDVVRKKSHLDPMRFGAAMSYLTRLRLVRQSGGNRLALTEPGKRLLAGAEADIIAGKA